MPRATLETAQPLAGADTGDLPMNFREKSAWLNVLAMLAAYSLYFGLILAGHPAGREVFPMLWLFGSIALAHAAVVIVGTIILSAQAPKSERVRADDGPVRNRSRRTGQQRRRPHQLSPGLAWLGCLSRTTSAPCAFSRAK